MGDTGVKPDEFSGIDSNFKARESAKRLFYCIDASSGEVVGDAFEIEELIQSLVRWYRYRATRGRQ